MGRIPARTALALCGALVVGAVSGCAAPTTESIVASAPPAVGTRLPASPVPTWTPQPVAVPAVPRSDARLGPGSFAGPAAPARVTIPSLELDMTVEPMGVDDDGLMELPPDTSVAGWYRFGSGLDAEDGTIVIAAHVDSNAYGLGPFAELRKLVPGAEILLSGPDGSTAAFGAIDVATTAKPDVPLAEVFSSVGPRRLVLVTCGGDFDYDTRHYLSNVIVRADALDGTG